MLRLALFHYNDLPIEIKVYSLKSQRWKNVEEQWPNKEICHWESLLAFNLASEKFKLYTTPVSPDFDHVMELKIKYFDTILVTA